MGDSNFTGVTTGREGSKLGLFTFDSTGPGLTGVTTPIVINASPLTPVYYEASIQVVTVGGGTAPTVGIGTTVAGTNLIGLTSSATAGFFPASNAVAKAVATDTTQIYIIEGGTPAGTGVYRILIQAASLNLNPTN